MHAMTIYKDQLGDDVDNLEDEDLEKASKMADSVRKNLFQKQ